MRMPSVSRRQALAYAVVLLALLALVGRSLVGGASDPEPAKPTETVPVLAVDEPSQASGESASLLVHVAGAVRQPGVYQLASGARVADAVERAGGPKARAALESINLAAELVDGQQVVVPVRPRPGAGGADADTAASPATGGATASGSAGSPVPGASATTGPISLSSASATELEQLPGVGPVTADKIVAHREEHGPFRAVDELAAVSGIGSARIEAIRDLVRP